MDLYAKKVFSIIYEQMSLFPGEGFDNNSMLNTDNVDIDSNIISTRLLEAFSISDIPFFNCDFDTIYPKIAAALPSEQIVFNDLNINSLIASETICAAICHQMNWDFLRKAVQEKTRCNPEWLSEDALSIISDDDVRSLLKGYNRIERIREKERANMLRQIGMLAKSHNGFTWLFFDSGMHLLSEEELRENLLQCPVFSNDPEEKKLQLLLQKLSNYPQFAELSNYCKPAIDYHLIRCFLRRGLVFPRTKLGVEFISSAETQRKESTVGALRLLCSSLIQEISCFTNLTINSVNQIEWYVGRSICKEGTPDCFLVDLDASWARNNFTRCPFFSTCCAINSNSELLCIDEPTYLGNSY